MQNFNIRLIVAVSAALSYFTFVQAETSDCGTVQETRIVQPEAKSYEIIPGSYEWQEGNIHGYSLEYRVELPRFENAKLIEEGYPVARFIAYKTKDERTRVQTKRPEYREVILPAQTQTFTRKKDCQLVSSARAAE